MVRNMNRPALFFALALLVTAAARAESPPTWNVPGGDPGRGRALIARFGCAGCHTIPGVRGAVGNVGPSLARIGDRTFVAGMLRNTPENLVRWLQHPQQVIPGNAMPEMGISEAEARDIASYLYTLR